MMLNRSAYIKRLSRIVLCGMLLLLPITVWVVTESWHEIKLIDIAQDGRNKLELYRSNLLGALKEHEYLPITLASDKRILDLVGFGAQSTTDEINHYLEKLAADSGASDIYVMDQNGTTIAASNWNSDASFIGRNFAFRPYFQQAQNGTTGHYFAFGITSNVPGYYIAHPIRPDGSRFNGAVVVKTHLEKLVQRWARGSESVLVRDENGVVIIASKPGWRFRDLYGLSTEKRDQLVSSRKYSNHLLEPMPLVGGAWPDADMLGTVTLQSRVTDDTNGPLLSDDLPHDQSGPVDGLSMEPDMPINRTAIADHVAQQNSQTTYLVTGSTLPTQGWGIYLLTDKSILDRSIISAGLMAGAAHIILTGLFFIILQRRRAFLEQLEIRDWSQRELERQVRLRTADLMNTNVRLAQEISERTRTEDALRSAQTELIQTSKLAALGQMSAGIAHEINQPLTAIRSYAENALKFLVRGNDETATKNLQRISELTDRMGRITRNLKTFARRPEQTIEPVDVTIQLHKALELVRDTASDGMPDIQTRMDADLGPVVAEPTQLTQVFGNIINNAVDACAQTPDARIDITAYRQGDRILIQIADNGPGISPENLSKIFDPFFTTKPFGDGLGLGLSICYGIVRGFGGSIRAENRPDGGACFTIDLRQCDSAASSAQNRSSTPESKADKTGSMIEIATEKQLDRT
ncbi:GHKL domain-containing protein [Thalassospira sp. MA62]|nr:GHKL domain-containing protein [Thalassospira sp. MA62]